MMNYAKEKNMFSEPASMYRDASNSHRELMSLNDVLIPRTLPKVLLVDDDKTFGKIMSRVASLSHVSLTYCQDLDDFSDLDHWDYDVAIVDYDLGEVTGYEITKYLEDFSMSNVPVILVSQSKQQDTKLWPNTIREFVHKSLGPYAIFDAAFEAHEISKIYGDMTR